MNSAVGGVLSVVAGLVTILLVFSEASYYLNPPAHSRVLIDIHQGEREVPVHMDLEFIAERCERLGLGFHDAQGRPYDSSRAAIEFQSVGPHACRLVGSLYVKQSAGAFFVTLRDLFMFGGGMLAPEEVMEFNASHVIRQLSFGPFFAGQKQPLSGSTASTARGGAQWQYHLSVVPTLHSASSVAGRMGVVSEQYAATQFLQHHDPANPFAVHPGLFVKYTFSPLAVQTGVKDTSFVQLITSVLAMSGGVWALAGVLTKLSRAFV